MVKMPFFLPTVFGAPIGGDPKGISSNAFALKKTRVPWPLCSTDCLMTGSVTNTMPAHDRQWNCYISIMPRQLLYADVW